MDRPRFGWRLIGSFYNCSDAKTNHKAAYCGGLAGVQLAKSRARCTSWGLISKVAEWRGPFCRAVSPSAALGSLRDMLGFLAVPDAIHFRTHDLRRGHAEDLKLSGASLLQILRAGELRSPAFLSYLDVKELESAAVMEAHLEDESDEDN